MAIVTEETEGSTQQILRIHLTMYIAHWQFIMWKQLSYWTNAFFTEIVRRYFKTGISKKFRKSRFNANQPLRVS